MPSHIPFVNSQKDCEILRKFYNDSKIVRVSIESIAKIKAKLPQDMSIWIDAGIDGYEHHLKKKDNPLPTYLHAFNEYKILSDPNFIKKPSLVQIKIFINSVMAECLKYKPKCITVPQLPVTGKTSRNKINSLLSKAAFQWKLDSQYDGAFIFLIIFTNQNQLNNKTTWRPTINAAIKRYHSSGAKGIWVVDSSLSDQQGTGTFKDRFPPLVQLHAYLKKEAKNAPIIAGPYWGMNLILWAKGLCGSPAISLGVGYQYHLAGGFKHKGKSRMAIPPLKRWAVTSPELRTWFNEAIQSLNSQDKVRSELQNLLGEFNDRLFLSNEDANRRQVAKFYKKWLDEIEETPSVGRALALYQDFSSAYVLGKQLPTLPRSGNSASRPERVAEIFMLNCL